ncbi:MAG: DUF4340 domain-containing protein [Candidatus Binatia bacterium]
MRLRNTLLLALAFVFLGAYLYFIELPRSKKDKSETLLAFKQEDVKSIVFTYPTQEIHLERQLLGRWMITQPLRASADASTISNILSILDTSKIKRTVEEHPTRADLKAFGLDRPTVRVLITLKGDQPPLTIRVGGRTPVGKSAYIRRGTQPGVLLASASLLSSLKKKLYDFRDKTIITVKDDQVKQLVLNGNKGDFLLVKKGKAWFIHRPKSYRADQVEIKGMLSTINNMSARSFLKASPSNLRKTGLDRPRLKVTVSVADEESQREILFGGKRGTKDEVYLTLGSGETIYTVYESVFKELNKDLVALRDKEILPFAKDQVVQLQIHTSKESLSFTRRGKKEWTLERPKEGKLTQSAVTDYLTNLRYLRAKGFADDNPRSTKPYGLASPSVKVVLNSAESKGLGTLLVGNKTGNDYYAKRAGDPTVFKIDAFSYNQLSKRLADFLKKQK